MTNASDQFETRLAALLAKMASLPPEQQVRLQPLVEAARRRNETLKADAAAARDALADWRIAMKYRIFSVEAARRERDS